MTFYPSPTAVVLIIVVMCVCLFFRKNIFAVLSFLAGSAHELADSYNSSYRDDDEPQANDSNELYNNPKDGKKSQ